eukprot:NODE_2920_length_970_cov_48.654804_g2900_i0.p1 GENE.NODE_2920_length_970_cov_48.654804_g2900_i0~~NODE_2920_length_970_cov_48.654804_g2900_i0.p1  ORF type:complete len:268 (+),score=44.10 NODE_2920_length_970_cov_48.654804_g2900_i0:61-864(+)
MKGGRFNKYGTAAEISDESAAEALAELTRRRPTAPVDENMTSMDDLYIRFLIASKYEVDEAERRLIAYEEWRQKHQLAAIFQANHPPKIPELHQCCFHGRDREGNPVYIEKPNQTNMRQLMKEFDQATLVRWHIYTMERARQRYKAMGGDRIAVILDCSGVGWSIMTDSAALAFLKAMTQVDQAMYPEHMRIMFLINAPRTIQALWNIIKPWLDPRVQAKIQITGKNYVDRLTQHIDPAQLPNEYGGTGGPLQPLSPIASAYQVPSS